MRFFAITVAAAVAMALQHGCAERSPRSDTSILPLARPASLDEFSCHAIEYSPDGQLLAAGGVPHWMWSYEIRLWDVETLEELAVLPALGTQVAAITPDGTAFATGSWFGDVSLWDMTTGERIRSVRGHIDTIRAIACSANGKWIATGSQDGTARLWDVTALREAARFEKHSDCVSAVTFTADSKQLVTAGGDDTIRFWDIEAKEEVKVLTDAGWAAEDIRFSPDGHWLAAVGVKDCIKGDAKLWALPEGRLQATFVGADEGVSFAPNGEFFATNSDVNATVTLLDVATRRQRASLIGNRKTYYVQPSHAFAPDSKTLAVGGNDLKLMDVATGEVQHVMVDSGGTISAITYSPDGTLLVAGISGKLVVWDVRTRKKLAEASTKALGISSLQFSPDGKRLLTGGGGGAYPGEYGTIQLIDATSGKLRHTLKGHRKPVTSVSFSPDGKMLAAGSRDRTVRLWEVASGMERAALSGHDKAVYAVAFSPNGERLATASESVRIWKTGTWNVLRVFEEPAGLVYSVAFSPDGTLLAAGGDDQQVRLWNVASNELKFVTKQHGWPVRAVAFAPNGKQFAIAGGTLQRGTVVLYNAETGLKQRNISEHAFPVMAVAFSPDGSQLATASSDKTVRLWDVKTGEQLSTSQKLESALTSVSFHPSSELIAVGHLAGATVVKRKRQIARAAR